MKTLVSVLLAFLLFAGNAKAQIEQQRAIPVETSISSESDYLALTIWGEARNQSFKGMYNVGSVVINRLRNGFRNRSYDSIRDVVTEPGQFEVWNRRNPNYHKLKTIPHLRESSKDYQAYVIAKHIAEDLIQNGTEISYRSFNSLNGKLKFRR
jgi:hypothetical protein